MVSCSVDSVEEDEEIEEETEFDEALDNSEMEEEGEISEENEDNENGDCSQIYNNDEMEQDEMDDGSEEDYDRRSNCTNLPSSSKLYSLNNMESDMNSLNYEYISGPETMFLYNNNGRTGDLMLNGSPCTTVMNGENLLFYEHTPTNNNCRNNNWSEEFHTVPPSREYS